MRLLRHLPHPVNDTLAHFVILAKLAPHAGIEGILQVEDLFFVQLDLFNRSQLEWVASTYHPPANQLTLPFLPNAVF
jgi:hypothetical protein